MKYIKLFEEHDAVQNNFKETNSEKQKESMAGLYGDADDYPEELNGIILIFIGNKNNFAITNDNGIFNVYTWYRMLDGIEKIGDSYKNVDDAKQQVLQNNK
jgi:hypothetical protein